MVDAGIKVCLGMGVHIMNNKGNSEMLFFIILFLLLFYDSSFIDKLRGKSVIKESKKDSSILFFIIIFLLLFY